MFIVQKSRSYRVRKSDRKRDGELTTYSIVCSTTSVLVKSSHFYIMYTTVNNLTLSHVLTCV